MCSIGLDVEFELNLNQAVKNHYFRWKCELFIPLHVESFVFMDLVQHRLCVRLDIQGYFLLTSEASGLKARICRLSP